MSVKGFGVSTQDLEGFFENSGEVLYDNFVGVFPSDKKHKFLEGELKKNLKSKKARCPFMVANPNLEKKAGTHWWSFLDTDAKDTLEINKLSDTAKHFFAFLDHFGEYKRISDNVKVVTVDDNL